MSRTSVGKVAGEVVDSGSSSGGPLRIAVSSPAGVVSSPLAGVPLDEGLRATVSSPAGVVSSPVGVSFGEGLHTMALTLRSSA